MDRSFLAFRQFLHRMFAGAEAPKPAPQPVRQAPPRQGEVREDWARIEL